MFGDFFKKSHLKVKTFNSGYFQVWDYEATHFSTLNASVFFSFQQTFYLYNKNTFQNIILAS